MIVHSDGSRTFLKDLGLDVRLGSVHGDMCEAGGDTSGQYHREFE